MTNGSGRWSRRTTTIRARLGCSRRTVEHETTVRATVKMLFDLSAFMRWEALLRPEVQLTSPPSRKPLLDLLHQRVDQAGLPQFGEVLDSHHLPRLSV